jgi:hypothetical protein
MKAVLLATALLAPACTPPTDNAHATDNNQAAATLNASVQAGPDLDIVLGSNVPPPSKPAAGFPYHGCSGEFAGFRKYVGGLPGAFLKEPAVRTRMESLMGPYLPRLEADLNVTGTVDLIGCELVVEGNARHSGGHHNAILSFSMYSGIMTIGIMAEDRLFVLVTPNSSRSAGIYDHLPAHVRDWMYVAADRFHSRSRQPPNLTRLDPLGK